MLFTLSGVATPRRWACALAPTLCCAVLIPPACAGLVVNEVQTAGLESAADEFVEIANTSATPIDLTGLRLVYRSAASTTDTVLVRFEDGALIPPGGVLVLGGAGYGGPRDGSFSGSLSSVGGGLAIRDGEGAFLDRVAWGTADNGFVETRATVAPAAGHSIHRIPCGHDSDYNARDLQELLVPTPRVQCDGTQAPSVLSAAFVPPGVEPGHESTLTATVSPGTYALASVTADLSALGGSQTAPLSASGGAWTLAVYVPLGTAPGLASVRVRAADARGGTGYAVAALYVQNPEPAPVVINEVQVAGATADTEFIELYNRTSAEVDLDGYTLVYRGPTSGDDTTLFSFTTARLKPHGFYLLGSAAFNGPKDAQMKYGLGGTGGGIALRRPDGGIVDSVGYGTAQNAFVETRAAPAPDAGESIQRVPAGADANDNLHDFSVNESPTPTPAVNKPVVTSVAFQPPAVPPGETTTLTVFVTPGDAEVVSVAADLIVILGETNQPLAKGAGNAWTVEVTVHPLVTIGAKLIKVFAIDALGLKAEGTGTLSVTDAQPVPPVKVNEVQTGSAASAAEEFVVLYNPSASAAGLTGWTLVYRSEKGTADSVLARLTGLAIAPRGYLLLATDAYGGPRDGPLSGTMAAAGGSVGLRDPTGALVDAVGYGTAANALVETSAAPVPEPGKSIGRRTAGQDTNNNAADFRVESPPSPRVGGGTVLRGDADGNGLLNMADAALAMGLAGGTAACGAAASPGGADVWPAVPDGRITPEDGIAIARAVCGGAWPQ